MDSKSFRFDLPKELIAQYPSRKRGESRLLVINPQKFTYEHKSKFSCFLDYVDKNTVLVFNNSRVRKARVRALSASGKRIEFLFLRKEAPDLWQVMVSKSKTHKEGQVYLLEGDIKATIVRNLEKSCKLIRVEWPLSEDFFERYGRVPLPPYIKRDEEEDDEDRYQNVFAHTVGSVAAPTAGLHFSEDFLSSLKEKSAGLLEVTLHVGLGTFEPIRCEKVEEHKMHSEDYFIDSQVATVFNQFKKDRKKILAVGTTTLRVLESASDEQGYLKAGEGSTDIFIYPGYRFKMVDSLLTNFHTPDSTLYLLVCAFAGQACVSQAYKEAIKQQYRFFSYGDATLFVNRI